MCGSNNSSPRHSSSLFLSLVHSALSRARAHQSKANKHANKFKKRDVSEYMASKTITKSIRLQISFKCALSFSSSFCDCFGTWCHFQLDARSMASVMSRLAVSLNSRQRYTLALLRIHSNSLWVSMGVHGCLQLAF